MNLKDKEIAESQKKLEQMYKDDARSFSVIF
jgi:hypothetical protein